MKMKIFASVWFLFCLVVTGWNVFSIVLNPMSPVGYICTAVTIGMAGLMFKIVTSNNS